MQSNVASPSSLTDSNSKKLQPPAKNLPVRTFTAHLPVYLQSQPAPYNCRLFLRFLGVLFRQMAEWLR